MTRQEFKSEFLTNSFHWIDESNYCIVQQIKQEFGIRCHYGNMIDWHDGFRNLQTFEPDQWHEFEYYQKTDFWHLDAPYGEAKDFDKMMLEYKQLSD